MSLGPAEILVVLVVALVLFGPKRLPEVGRQVGGALRELRKIQDTVQNEMRTVLDETVGPVHRMMDHNPSPNATASDPTPPMLAPIEPDLGDEKPALPAPGATEPVADDSERPGIDGLSGGTFS
jgi:sec-independent protein translocase protein TatA